MKEGGVWIHLAHLAPLKIGFWNRISFYIKQGVKGVEGVRTLTHSHFHGF